ncbi:hypothetical protein CHARACLAT_015213 [Characodon lateralis]|uniref:Uncharacterized protein n=1 Tax=Characodon lateralis TaxID=208331 RepID=A0ABU7F5Q6_9TELE|nr:hypothetical protein [Characodon lateralis]
MLMEHALRYLIMMAAPVVIEASAHQFFTDEHLPELQNLFLTLIVVHAHLALLTPSFHLLYSLGVIFFNYIFIFQLTLHLCNKCFIPRIGRRTLNSVLTYFSSTG